MDGDGDGGVVVECVLEVQPQRTYGSVQRLPIVFQVTIPSKGEATSTEDERWVQ